MSSSTSSIQHIKPAVITIPKSQSAKWHRYGFAVAIIAGVGGLLLAGVGVAACVGTITAITQAQAMVMLFTGTLGGGTLLGIGLYWVLIHRSLPIQKTPIKQPSPTKTTPTHTKRPNQIETGSLLKDPSLKIQQRSTETSTSKKLPSFNITYMLGSGSTLNKKETPSEKIIIIKEAFTQASAFLRVGQQEWEDYMGNVGEVPPLPDNLQEILERPCPFFKDKKNQPLKIKNTHMLLLIPAQVEGLDLTLDTFKNLIQHPKQGNNATTYGCYSGRVGHIPFGPSRWVLMTRDNIPGSLGETYQTRQERIHRYASQGYRMPSVQEAVVSICMSYVSAGVLLSFRNYSTEVAITTACRQEAIYTCCSDIIPNLPSEEENAVSYPPSAETMHLVVGGFTSRFGVNISSSLFPSHEFDGVAAVLPL